MGGARSEIGIALVRGGDHFLGESGGLICARPAVEVVRVSCSDCEKSVAEALSVGERLSAGQRRARQAVPFSSAGTTLSGGLGLSPSIQIAD